MPWLYVRGHPNDFNDWGEAAPGWDWSQLEPLYRRLENWTGEANEYRGQNGPLSIHDIREDAHPLTRNYLRAAEQAGIPINPDYNAVSMEGAGLYQITTKGGRRMSASRAYLDPVRHQANLDIKTNARANNVVFENGRATGIVYSYRGRLVRAKARGEIILCGGAINSPQLLQLSGIGPGALLQDKDIDVIRANENVGQHMQDHLGMDNHYRSTVPTLNDALRPALGKLRAGIRYVLTRKGPLSLSLNQAGGFVKLDETSRHPAYSYISRR